MGCIKWLLRQMPVPSNGCSAKRRLCQMAVAPNGCYAKWLLRETAVAPNGCYAKWLLRQMAIAPTGYSGKWLFHQLAILANGYCTVTKSALVPASATQINCPSGTDRDFVASPSPNSSDLSTRPFASLPLVILVTARECTHQGGCVCRWFCKRDMRINVHS